MEAMRCCDPEAHLLVVGGGSAAFAAALKAAQLGARVTLINEGSCHIPVLKRRSAGGAGSCRISSHFPKRARASGKRAATRPIAAAGGGAGEGAAFWAGPAQFQRKKRLSTPAERR